MKRFFSVLILLMLCLLLDACGTESAPPVTESAVPDETPVQASEEPVPTAEPLRNAEGDLVFPNGSVYHGSEIKIRLPGLLRTDLERTIALLGEMPNLHTVDLGEKQGARGLSLQNLWQLRRVFPEVDFVYRFTLWGKELSTMDTELDLKYVPMEDEGAMVARLLRCMPHCKSLDMDSCGVSSEAMSRLREAFPEVEINWRIWFGKEFSVRTDTERIYATNHVKDDNCQDLKYCTRVRFLDLGHNPDLSDISFIENMPELEACILAIMPFRDLTPLSGCTKMEYLELCEIQPHPGKELDLAPLAGMTHLHHLNICKLYEVKNYEFLENCKELERLWIGQYTYIPDEYIEHLKKVLPDTTINWWTQTCVTETWREDPPGIWVPRYAKLREQFDYDHYDKTMSFWWNDPLCHGNEGNLEREALKKLEEQGENDA